MNKQEVINELKGLINIINMNKSLFKESYNEDLILAVNHIIKKIKHNEAGVEIEDNKKHKYRTSCVETITRNC